MATTIHLSQAMGKPLVDASVYRSTIVALQYATLTRPDISFSVNKVCQFLNAPADEHWQVVKQILRYLKETISHGLLLNINPTQHLVTYSDVDWAGCPDDKKSTKSFATFLGDSLISQSTRKQAIVARSSTDSEYHAIANATIELIWLSSLH
ncbi:uncharacterized mitochondrial protein AtMg00810-like [Macadamia integrifolia]|uniref:uncharacterized mitochondrial protein AtMg00810-like n=1 Tax=Macadamia integrifolia TaxID=60698 RepID=UPI001C4FD23F|nr:uncharacterized mitochondrial protein AtMg00810-like [Macadamia integrifolia]